MTSAPSDRPDAPRVSVLMPVHNGETYLAEAIDSVLAQGFADFEFLIHDDGSTDGSAGILAGYAARDPRIRVTQGANAGVAAALNRMARAARGTYLARMDADDLCLPERFAKQVAALDAAPELALLSTDCMVIDAAGRPISYVRTPVTHEEMDALHLRGHCAIMHPTVMMRRTTLERVGGYTDAFRSAQDLDLWLRIGEIGRLANLPEVLLRYRIHDKSVSSGRRQEQERNARQACAEACARRGVTVPYESTDWRMQDTPASKRKFYLRYAWQAWNAGFRDTWRHYALQSVRLAPFSADAWKVLVLGALRRPRKARRHG